MCRRCRLLLVGICMMFLAQTSLDLILESRSQSFKYKKKLKLNPDSRSKSQRSFVLIFTKLLFLHLKKKNLNNQTLFMHNLPIFLDPTLSDTQAVNFLPRGFKTKG